MTCDLCGGSLREPWNPGEPWKCRNCGAEVMGPKPIEEAQKVNGRSWWLRAVAGCVFVLALVACDSDADVVSENLSKAADQFEVQRRIVFFNGITDTYLLEITGACSIADEGDQLEVTCKVGEDSYKKHFLGLSDNASYFVEQLEGETVSKFFYRVIFKPTTIIPDPTG